MPKEQPNYKELVLAALPGTVPQIAKAAKIATKTVRRWLAALMRPGPERKVRIVSWVRRLKGKPVAVYGLGTGPSEPRPAAFTNAERCARYTTRAARQERRERVEREKAAKLAAQQVEKADYRKDPLLFWIPSRAGLEARA